MNLLAFDTSTEAMSIAVGRVDASGQLAPASVHAYTGPGGAQASALLIPQVLQLLQQAGLSLDQLDAIVFGAGPGSFTGLRTACSVAQGLAFGARGGLGVPVLPVCTLMAVAEEARATHGAAHGATHDAIRVMALLDARMDEVYAAAYEYAAGHWQALVEPSLLRPEAVVPPPGALLAGNVWPVYASRWSDAVRAAPQVSALPTASALLRLAPALIAQGEAVPAAQAMPIYIRDKVAQTTEERAALKASASPKSSPP